MKKTTSLSKFFKKLCIDNDMQEKELAELFDLRQQTMSNILTGRRNVAEFEIREMVEVMKINKWMNNESIDNQISEIDFMALVFKHNGYIPVDNISLETCRKMIDVSVDAE